MVGAALGVIYLKWRDSLHLGARNFLKPFFYFFIFIFILYNSFIHLQHKQKSRINFYELGIITEVLSCI